MVEEWWFSSRAMTFLVRIEAGIVTWTPAIARKLIGQPVANLERWMSKQGGFCKEQLPSREGADGMG